jgi:hypothetical protein
LAWTQTWRKSSGKYAGSDPELFEPDPKNWKIAPDLDKKKYRIQHNHCLWKLTDPDPRRNKITDATYPDPATEYGGKFTKYLTYFLPSFRREAMNLSVILTRS